MSTDLLPFLDSGKYTDNSFSWHQLPSTRQTIVLRVPKNILEEIKIYCRKAGKPVGEWVETAWKFTTSYLDIRYKLEFMSVLQELARRKKVAVILSIHELDLAERVSDWVLCVSPGQESQFGRPEEMLTPEHLSELFQVEEGRFRQTGGSMELPRPEGAPEVFVLAGGGSGRAVFWQLQRDRKSVV